MTGLLQDTLGGLKDSVMNKVTCGLLLCVSLTVVGLRAQGSHKSGLTSLLEAEAARFVLQAPDDMAPATSIEFEALRERKPLGVGIYVKHLVTGGEATVRPDVVFETQSVFKLPI